MVNDAILPPEGGWGTTVFTALISDQKENMTDNKMLTPELVQALMAKPSQVVMAPERKIPIFEGREDSHGKSIPVEEFVIAIGHAMNRYNIPEDQQGQFLLDSLRGNPKTEVRSLLAGGKDVDEALKYLKSSYGETLTSGELQRQFLGKRQQHGESIRQFGVDLQQLFYRLKKKDPALYKQPDIIIREQFVDGIEYEGLRHSCRDLVDRDPSISFDEVKQWAIKREEREKARTTTTTHGVCATIGVGGQTLDNPIQRLEKQMEQVIDSVRTLTSLIPTKPELTQTASRPQVTQHPVQQQHNGPNNMMRGPGVSSIPFDPNCSSFIPNPYHGSVPFTAPKCYNCGQPGHYARNCPAPRRSYRAPSHPLQGNHNNVAGN